MNKHKNQNYSDSVFSLDQSGNKLNNNFFGCKEMSFTEKVENFFDSQRGVIKLEKGKIPTSGEDTTVFPLDNKFDLTDGCNNHNDIFHTGDFTNTELKNSEPLASHETKEQPKNYSSLDEFNATNTFGLTSLFVVGALTVFDLLTINSGVKKRNGDSASNSPKTTNQREAKNKESQTTNAASVLTAGVAQNNAAGGGDDGGDPDQNRNSFTPSHYIDEELLLDSYTRVFLNVSEAVQLHNAFPGMTQWLTPYQIPGIQCDIFILRNSNLEQKPFSFFVLKDERFERMDEETVIPFARHFLSIPVDVRKRLFEHWDSRVDNALTWYLKLHKGVVVGSGYSIGENRSDASGQKEKGKERASSLEETAPNKQYRKDLKQAIRESSGQESSSSSGQEPSSSSRQEPSSSSGEEAQVAIREKELKDLKLAAQRARAAKSKRKGGGGKAMRVLLIIGIVDILFRIARKLIPQKEHEKKDSQPK